MHSVSKTDGFDIAGMEVYKREYLPAHYSLKVEGFSLLSQTKVEKRESGIFEAGGHKWSLCLYPDGDKKFDGEGHVSLYLVIEGTDELNPGWEVNVNFRLFVLDQKSNMYLTIQDSNGAVRKFHELKREWGFPRLISLDTLRDASNGYLVDDSCIFGAEVFVMKPLGRWDSLAMTTTTTVPSSNKYTWRLDHYSEMNQSYYYSDPFRLGERTWKLMIYPKGESRANGKFVSLFLYLVGAKDDLSPKRKLYVEYALRVLDQLNNNHRECKKNTWFSSSQPGWGYCEFMSLEELHNPVKGFVYKDAVKVEAQILQIREFTVRDGTSAEKKPSQQTDAPPPPPPPPLPHSRKWWIWWR